MKWQIGDVTVTKVVELETTGGSRFILPQATREAVLPISWLIPHFADDQGRLKMSIHALMVEAPGRRIIVDTCLGNDKKDRAIPTWNDRQGRFLEDLASAGFQRETIDTVLCTHLHVDHVGWNTMLSGGQWVPTFPKARYLFGRVEYAYWSTQTERTDMLPVFADSIRPVFERGLADLVEWDHQICPEIRLMPSTGHSPRPCQCPDQLERKASHDHGRFRSSSLPDGTPRVVFDCRFRPAGSGGNPPSHLFRAGRRARAGNWDALRRPDGGSYRRVTALPSSSSSEAWDPQPPSRRGNFSSR